MSKPFRVNILTVFPEMFDSFFSASILGRAQEQEMLDIRVTDIRPFSASKHHNTDDYPFGGGAGMVMLAQPVMDAMAAVSADYDQTVRPVEQVKDQNISGQIDDAFTSESCEDKRNPHESAVGIDGGETFDAYVGISLGS